LRTTLKKILDTFFHPLGLNIERYFGEELALKDLIVLAQKNQVDLLLDVGANTGQFAKKIRRLGFNEEIVSFEPLTSAYSELVKNARNDSRWKVYDQCAIGDFDGEIEINVSANSHSSSILNVSKVHLDAAPSAAYMAKEKVSIKKLDTVAPELAGNRILLKIDTQGFEDKVLSGAKEKMLQRVKIIQLEMSLLPLYENAMLFPQMLQLLSDLGYEPVFYSPGYTNRTNEHIQQVEGYFIKKPK
jgi:FkbM family methyltransferase